MKFLDQCKAALDATLEYVGLKDSATAKLVVVCSVALITLFLFVGMLPWSLFATLGFGAIWWVRSKGQ